MAKNLPRLKQKKAENTHTMPNALPDDMRQEMAQIESQFTMSPTERRRKLIRWVIRQMLTVILYYFLWDAHPWVPLSLWFVVPRAILSLVSILAYNWFIQRKLRKTGAADDRLEQVLKHNDEAEES